jgi:hypothetical protein
MDGLDDKGISKGAPVCVFIKLRGTPLNNITGKRNRWARRRSGRKSTLLTCRKTPDGYGSE